MSQVLRERNPLWVPLPLPRVDVWEVALGYLAMPVPVRISRTQRYSLVLTEPNEPEQEGGA